MSQNSVDHTGFISNLTILQGPFVIRSLCCDDSINIELNMVRSWECNQLVHLRFPPDRSQAPKMTTAFTRL